MSNLIEITGDEQRVSARELHKAVGSTERFSAWFERQLQYGFSEGVDYVGCKTFNTLAKQELQDYQMSVSMAKEICMVQKSEKAREVRKYLITIENKWNQPELVMARALKMAAGQIDELKLENKELHDKIEADKPKTIFADAVTASDSAVLVRDLAKMIRQNGYEIGEKRLYNWMRENGYICKGTTMPTQKAMELGLFEIEIRTIERGVGLPLERKTTKVTGKGQIYFANKFLA